MKLMKDTSFEEFMTECIPLKLIDTDMHKVIHFMGAYDHFKAIEDDMIFSPSIIMITTAVCSNEFIDEFITKAYYISQFDNEFIDDNTGKFLINKYEAKVREAIKDSFSLVRVKEEYLLINNFLINKLKRPKK